MMAEFVKANRTQLRSLGTKCFKTHVVQKRGSHMKGFASDMVTVLCFLNGFCLRTLIPERALEPRARAVCLAHDIISLLRTGDAAVQQADVIRQMIVR